MLTLMSLKKFTILSGVILLSSCATLDLGKSVDKSQITIETKRSRFASIGYIDIYEQKDESLIRGKVRRNYYGRGTIPGHIDIELTDAAGKNLFKEVTYSRQSSLRSHTADFSVKIPFHISKGSRLLIMHHDAGHRRDCIETDKQS